MKILFAYEQDATDPLTQSGRPLSILRAMLELGHDVRVASPLKSPPRLPYLFKRVSAGVMGKSYRQERNPKALYYIAAQISAALQAGPLPDIIFSPGSLAISALSTQLPIVFCADATFHTLLNFYPAFTRLSADFIGEGHRQEQAALSRCSIAVYPSEWAAKSAIEFYGANPSKVHVIPFGACIRPPESLDIQRSIEERLNDTTLRLLFVGRDWIRKGGPQAVSLTRALIALGVNTTLDIVGPQITHWLPSFCRRYGPLRRSISAEKSTMEDLFRRSHFMIGLSTAEAFGLAFCDACSFGLPSVSYNVGGVSAIVRHGENGICIEPDQEVAEIASLVKAAFEDKELYRKLAGHARQDHDLRLNWRAFTSSLFESIENIIR